MHHQLSAPYWAGNQGWLQAYDPLLARAGCGVVAFADLVRYRAQLSPAEGIPLTQSCGAGRLSPRQYALFLRQFSRLYCQLLLPFGMSGLRLAHVMRQFYRYHIPSRHIHWVQGNLVRDPLAHFRAQLARDFPVILTLPPYLLGKPLTLYTDTTCTHSIAYRTHGGHFVTLIGIQTHPTHGILLQIASWGKVYFVRYLDYWRVLTQPTAWLGGGWIGM